MIIAKPILLYSSFKSFQRVVPKSTALFSTLSNHKLNCEKALKKAHEGESLSQLAAGPIGVLQGIGPANQEIFDKLGLESIQDLAEYKFYKMAKSITALADTSCEGDFRPEDSTMNINKAVMKKGETQAFCEIRDSPVASLQGLSDEKGEMFSTIGVNSVEDLANLKYCLWAEAIVELSKYEE
mmetsp:Transcript_591/g.714  ORF Transcript_591/g.714 Transcript_591/m.714 type:complete len:183 (+) Transcript_591:54-602(+)